MSAVIGPTNKLPGDSYPVEPDDTCDDCEEIQVYTQATHGVVSEVDGFGGEVMHFCHEHYKQYMASLDKECGRSCIDCGSTIDVIGWRDPEEGQFGKVYELCKVCRVNRGANIFAEDLDEDFPDE